MFGSSPSLAAIAASKVFKRESVNNILELGGGQGRDSLFFARKGFCIDVLDYSYSGIATINKKANILNLSQFITAKYHDVRKSLPFNDESFDSCFSHMLYCMAFTTNELKNLSTEIKRVLKPGGYCWIYTDGGGGIRDYIGDLSQEILRDINKNFVIKIVRSMGLTTNKEYHLSDTLNALYRHTNLHNLKKKLSSIGFKFVRQLKGGFRTDFEKPFISSTCASFRPVVPKT